MRRSCSASLVRVPHMNPETVVTMLVRPVTIHSTGPQEFGSNCGGAGKRKASYRQGEDIDAIYGRTEVRAVVSIRPKEVISTERGTISSSFPRRSIRNIRRG